MGGKRNEKHILLKKKKRETKGFQRSVSVSKSVEAGCIMERAQLKGENKCIFLKAVNTTVSKKKKKTKT